MPVRFTIVDKELLLRNYLESAIAANKAEATGVAAAIISMEHRSSMSDALEKMRRRDGASHDEVLAESARLVSDAVRIGLGRGLTTPEAMMEEVASLARDVRQREVKRISRVFENSELEELLRIHIAIMIPRIEYTALVRAEGKRAELFDDSEQGQAYRENRFTLANKLLELGTQKKVPIGLVISEFESIAAKLDRMLKQTVIPVIMAGEKSIEDSCKIIVQMLS